MFGGYTLHLAVSLYGWLLIRPASPTMILLGSL
jgi:hypothetical protein